MARRTVTDDNTKGRGHKLRPLSSSEKADNLSALIASSLGKRDRLKAREQARKPGKREPAGERRDSGGKKKKAKSSFNPLDLVGGHLPAKERDIVKALVDGTDDSDAEEVQSLFEGAFGALHEDASNPNADFRSDEATKNMQRATLALMLSLIPIAERTYRQTRKQTDAYALNAFIDQARAIADSLRMLSDADNQVEFISRRILTPLFLSTGQTLISEVSALKATVDTEISDKHAAKKVKQNVDSMTMSIGKYLREVQQGIISQVAAYLQGDTSAFEIPAAIQQRPKANKRRKSHD